jgi:hypothetical protein
MAKIAENTVRALVMSNLQLRAGMRILTGAAAPVAHECVS